MNSSLKRTGKLMNNYVSSSSIDNSAIFSKKHIVDLIHRTHEPIIIVQSCRNQQIGLLPNLPSDVLQSALQQYQLNLIAISPPLFT